jgi:hypothetical protein
MLDMFVSKKKAQECLFQLKFAEESQSDYKLANHGMITGCTMGKEYPT